tara:strand:- start:140 stop:403 length:264 start_codon:yes stop_codon:yes gene_type:complete
MRSPVKVGRIQENAVVEASLEEPNQRRCDIGEYFCRDNRPVKQSESRSLFRFIWRAKLNVRQVAKFLSFNALWVAEMGYEDQFGLAA